MLVGFRQSCLVLIQFGACASSSWSTWRQSKHFIIHKIIALFNLNYQKSFLTFVLFIHALKSVVTHLVSWWLTLFFFINVRAITSASIKRHVGLLTFLLKGGQGICLKKKSGTSLVMNGLVVWFLFYKKFVIFILWRFFQPRLIGNMFLWWHFWKRKLNSLLHVLRHLNKNIC